MAVAEPERPSLPIQPEVGVNLEDLPIFAQFPQSNITHDKAEVTGCTAFTSFYEQLQDLILIHTCAHGFTV